MIERIFHFAKTTPDAVAIYYHGSELTYRAFADAIGAARTAFAAAQVGGDGVAALVVGDLREFWIDAFALNTLGLTTIGVRDDEELAEFDLPDLRFVVSDQVTPVLDRMRIERGVRLITPPSLQDPPSWPDASDCVGRTHLLFTSGTTGRKKMILGEIRMPEVSNLHTDATMVHHVFNYGPWTLTGYGVPVSVWNTGGAVLIHDGDDHHAALRDLRATHAGITPRTLNEMLAAPEGAYPFNERLLLAIGGASVPWAQIEEAKRRIAPVVLNVFASTEVAAVARTLLQIPEDQRWHQTVPGKRVEVVDEHDRPVPAGTIGQLRVATDDGPSSYYPDPDASAAFFRDGFFYPGDLVAMREDGRFALHGRTTDVINMHGTKMSPVSCERTIEDTLGLGPCCTVSAPDRLGGERLYVVVEHPEFLAPANVEWLTGQLTAAFGAPFTADIMPIARLPRTGTGKIIRREVHALVARREERRIATE